MSTHILTAAAIAGALAFAAPAQAGDTANGEDVFKKCRACHQVGAAAKNAVGPLLNGLFGRKAGTIEGFSYSEANKSSGLTWDEATFAKYIKDPRGAMPGNKMAFVGLKNEKDVADLIAFLKQFDAAGSKK
jgi:cytochrome c